MSEPSKTVYQLPKTTLRYAYNVYSPLFWSWPLSSPTSGSISGYIIDDQTFWLRLCFGGLERMGGMQIHTRQTVIYNGV